MLSDAEPVFEVQDGPSNRCSGEWRGWVTLFLRTDVAEEAVSALEMVAESVATAQANIYRWKRAIVALHSAVQGLMVMVSFRRVYGLVPLASRLGQCRGPDGCLRPAPRENNSRFEASEARSSDLANATRDARRPNRV